MVATLTGSPGDWLRARDARARLVTSVLLVVAVVGLDRPEVLVVAALAALAVALATFRDPRRLLHRLLAVEWLLLVLVLTLPFTVDGEPVFALGPLQASDAGLERALTVLLKANAAALAVLGLLGGLAPNAFGHALGRLGVPDRLVQLLVLTVRQIDLLQGEYGRLRRAMRARAFRARSTVHTWRSLGWLIGMLLVRATARAHRLVAAMRCRGYRGRLVLLDRTHWSAGDTLLVAGGAAFAGGLLVLEGLA
jgi:cobalt/nickel transport system permease protein